MDKNTNFQKLLPPGCELYPTSGYRREANWYTNVAERFGGSKTLFRDHKITQRRLTKIAENLYKQVLISENEREILEAAKILRRQLEQPEGIDRFFVGVPTEVDRNMDLKVEGLQNRQRYLDQGKTLPLSKKFEMKAVSGEALSLPVKICGFITDRHDIYEILLTLLREQIIPERKQFIINYTTPREVLGMMLNAINSLNPTEWLCKFIEYSKEGNTAATLQEFAYGLLRGIFLPLHRGLIGDEVKRTLANTSYLIHLYCMPMFAERAEAYWERVEYSKYVDNEVGRQLTIIDFVEEDCVHLYQDMHNRKGFIFGHSSPNAGNSTSSAVQSEQVNSEDSHDSDSEHFDSNNKANRIASPKADYGTKEDHIYLSPETSSRSHLQTASAKIKVHESSRLESFSPPQISNTTAVHGSRWENESHSSNQQKRVYDEAFAFENVSKKPNKRQMPDIDVPPLIARCVPIVHQVETSISSQYTSPNSSPAAGTRTTIFLGGRFAEHISEDTGAASADVAINENLGNQNISTPPKEVISPTMSYAADAQDDDSDEESAFFHDYNHGQAYASKANSNNGSQEQHSSNGISSGSTATAYNYYPNLIDESRNDNFQSLRNSSLSPETYAASTSKPNSQTEWYSLGPNNEFAFERRPRTQ